MTTMPKGINWNEQFYKLLRLSLRLTQEFIVDVNAETYPQKTMLFITHRTTVSDLCDEVIKIEEMVHSSYQSPRMFLA
jgi:hypothetical protein